MCSILVYIFIIKNDVYKEFLISLGIIYFISLSKKLGYEIILIIIYFKKGKYKD